MKNYEQINEEIEQQISVLISKNVEPTVLLIGDLAYLTLKETCKEMQVYVQNNGFVLRRFKGLKVIQDIENGGYGCYKKEQEQIQVLGR